MLTATVGTGKQYLYTEDDAELLVRPVWVSTPEGRMDFRDIGGHFADISIQIEGSRRKISLSSKLETGILTFLAEFQGKQRLEMDCYAFVNLVYGNPAHRCDQLLDYWELRPMRWWLRHGQIISLLCPARKEFRHAAIYLGRGLFISVCGAGGDLEIADLKDMLQGFKAEQAFIASPRN